MAQAASRFCRAEVEDFRPRRRSSRSTHRSGGRSAPLFGSGAVSIAGAAGTQALTNTNLTTHVVRLTGAITGNRTVTIPAGNGGRAHLFVNATTGLYTVRLEGPSGGFCYLLPGQSREVWVDDTGTLRGEALHVLAAEMTITLAGDAVGDVARAIATLPAPFLVDRCEQITLTDTSGGTSKSSVGQNPAGASPQYSDLLTQATTPATSVAPLGKASGDLGSAMATDGSAFFSTSKTIYHNHNVSGSTVTYPLYVNAAVKAAVPPQINVLATAILVVSLVLLALGTLYRRKRL